MVYHNREYTLLHLTGVLRSEDNHLHTLEVDLNGSCRRHALGESVRGELTGVVDDKVRFTKVGELLLGRTDEHVVLQTRSDRRHTSRERNADGP